MAMRHLAFYRRAALSNSLVLPRGQSKNPRPHLEDEGFTLLVVPPPFAAMLAQATSHGSFL